MLQGSADSRDGKNMYVSCVFLNIFIIHWYDDEECHKNLG